MPSATQGELAEAIGDCIDAGARVVNLSLALAQPSSRGERALEEALTRAVKRGVIVVAAAGNQSALGSSAITRHPWVIPVAACDGRGRPMNLSKSRRLDRPARLERARRRHHQSERRRTADRVGWHKRRRAFCYRRGCASVVGISRRERRANQARGHPVFDGSAFFGGSAFAGRRLGTRLSFNGECRKVNRDECKPGRRSFGRERASTAPSALARFCRGR